jgi:hypothetical protein
MVRVDQRQSDTLLATTNARLMEMRGRRMNGWTTGRAGARAPQRQLAEWVELGTTHARSLPAKREAFEVCAMRSSYAARQSRPAAA